MRWLATNIRTFLLAFILALAVWISAVTSADPDEEHTLNTVHLDVVGQDPSLIITSQIPPSVQVTLRAPRSTWDQLNAQDNSVQATLDLSGYGSGDYALNIQLRILVRPVQIVRANPTTVKVHLERIAVRTLPIDLSINGKPAIGYEASPVSLDPNQITISGPEYLVKEASQAKVAVSLTGARANIDQAFSVQIEDAKNSPVKNIIVSPESVHVTIPVSQQGGFRDVAVKVIVQGQQAPGYRIDNISVFPPVVTVFSSNPELVNALPGVIETQPLDIQGAKENISTRLSLNLTGNVAVIGSSLTVQVNVDISPIQTSLSLLNQPINIIGLPEGLEAQVSPQTLDVIISGPLPGLEGLIPHDVTVNVDVTGLEPGTHQLTPKVDVHVPNVLVESILPGTVEVILSIPETPTPTPKP